MKHIVLAGTFIIEPLKETLTFWSQKFPLPFSFSFAPYNQLFQQLLDPLSMISKNRGGMNVVILRSCDLNHLKQSAEELAKAVEFHMEQYKSRFIVAICPEESKSSNSQKEFELGLIKSLENILGVSVIETTVFQDQNIYDAYTEQLAHIPFTSSFYVRLGTLISREVYSATHPSYKAIVLDCDNTLWQGVASEEGPLNVTVTPYHLELQKFMLKQKEEGKLLFLASKNNEDEIRFLFENHPKMLLKWDDFISTYINWMPKWKNIQLISQVNHIGLDSIIFLDDNPIEYAEMRHSCREVLSLLLPAQIEEIPSFLENIWMFDQKTVTAEDERRTEFYRQNHEREKIRKQFSNFADFIQGLKIEMEFADFNESSLERIAQLTMRTNQFNFTTIRRTIQEILHLKDQSLHGIAVQVKDRLGSYGIVGVIIYSVKDNLMFIETFLLSCRVLGKGIEHRMLAHLAKKALALNIQEIEIAFQVTAKNLPAYQFLNHLEQTKISKEINTTYYRLDALKTAALTFDPLQVAFVEPLKEGLSSENIVSMCQSCDLANQLAHFNAIYFDEESLLQATQELRPRPTINEEYEPPTNPLQKEIVSLWQSLLKWEPIGIKDHFCSLQGDSLITIQLIALIAKTYSIYLNPADLLSNFTVEKLADLLIKKQQEMAISNTPKVKNQDEESLKRNSGKLEGLQTKTIITLFEEQVTKTPEAIAVITEEEQISFHTLNQRASQIASFLIQEGIQKESIIAVASPRGKDFISPLLGILKAGAAFVLIDAEYPESYQLHILKDSEARMFLIHSHLKDKFDFYEGVKIAFDCLSAEIVTFNPLSTQNLAYLIYTSGSTGLPKGVMIEHRSLANLATAIVKKFQITCSSRMLQFSVHSFDAVIFEIFPSLIAGACLFLTLSKVRLNPVKMAKFLKLKKISVAVFPPSFVAMTSEVIDFSTLETLIIAGEPNREDVLKKWLGKVRIINAYGPTEATVCATTHDCISLNDPINTIGKPIDGMQVYILDEDRQIVPVGVVGELYLAGDQVARGYLNLPKMTSEVFFNDPFSKDANARMCKTGDFARWLPDNNIEFIGRKDSQIKLHGFRIDLLQIESQLVSLDSVKQAVVLLNEKEQLTAYLILKENNRSQEEMTKEIHLKLGHQLPSFMLPSAYVFLNSFPFLSNGKVNRLALQHRQNLKHSKERPSIPPKTSLEYQLVQLFEEILKVEGIGRFDDFFALGGNSLQSIQLIAKIFKHFGLIVNVNVFYSNSTIAKLAEQLSAVKIKKNKDLKIFEKFSKALKRPVSVNIQQKFQNKIQLKWPIKLSLSRPNADHSTSLLDGLLPIETKGKEQPLVLIHPSMGLAFPYAVLGNTLSRPLYGISNPFIGSRRFSCLKEMAAYYVRILKASPLKKPYHLGGWSFGGLVAFEMAHQLQMAGEEVQSLILIDSRLSMTRQAESLEAIAGALKIAGINPNSDAGHFISAEMQNNIKLTAAYRPSSIYKGRVVLLKAVDAPLCDPANGFDPYVNQKIEIYSLTGKHMELFHGDSIKETIQCLKTILVN